MQLVNPLDHQANFVALLGSNLYWLDLWYRKKYQIRFGSPEHEACRFSDMLFEAMEEIQINRRGKGGFSVSDFLRDVPKMPDRNRKPEKPPGAEDYEKLMQAQRAEMEAKTEELNRQLLEELAGLNQLLAGEEE